MNLREELIKFNQHLHEKLGVLVDVPVGISIIEDVDEYLNH